MRWHFADIWEVVADTVPEAPALVHGDTKRNWAEYDDRAARLATVLTDHGLGPDSKVAIFAYNSNEYLEAQYGIFKIRGVPINVNYRYFEDELVYLFDNSDAEAVFFQAQFADRIRAIRAKIPKVKVFIEIDDGSGEHLDGAISYEAALTAADPMARIERAEEDIYMLYTGGTTGMPKGVMYYHGDFSRNMLLGLAARGIAPPDDAEGLAAAVRQIHDEGAASRAIPACPLMHGTGMWLAALSIHNIGGCVVTFENTSFDPHALWKLVEKENVTDMAIVGDAFAKPMLQALEAAKAAGESIDISSLTRIISSGVMFSTPVKRGLLEFGDFTIVDAMGSTEGGMGSSVVTRDTPEGETGKFTMNETTKVFTDDDKLVAPGSGDIGMIANGGLTPVGYFKDPEKSAVTFREIDGHRYGFAGDYATIEADGTLVLLGRGSVCINTGGEKVFPEEVEEVVKSHPAVYDCLVVGVPDERFGEKVTAVTSFREGESTEEETLIEWLHGKLAGYKLPRTVLFVPEVMRAQNGKADYGWAKETALELTGTNAA